MLYTFGTFASVGPVPAGARLSGYLLDGLLHHLFNLLLSVGPVPAGARLSGYLLDRLLHHLFNLQLSVGPVPAGARLAGYVSANQSLLPPGQARRRAERRGPLTVANQL